MPENPKSGKGETPEDPLKSRPLFHDDENLQDEQELFDQENANSKLNIALLSRLMQVRGNECETADSKQPKTYTVTFGAGYPSPKNSTNAKKVWDRDFCGKTITTRSSSHFLELCDAETSCLIRLVLIDTYLESDEAKNELKLKELEAKAEDEKSKLRDLTNRTEE